MRKWLFLAMLVCSVALKASIAFVTSSTGTASTSTTCTFSLTTDSSANRIIVVGVGHHATSSHGSATSATWNGASMTKLTSTVDIASGLPGEAYFYLTNPAASTNGAITVTMGITSSQINAVAAEYSGYSSMGAFTVTTGNAKPQTGSLTTLIANSWISSAMAIDDIAAFGVDPAFTERNAIGASIPSQIVGDLATTSAMNYNFVSTNNIANYVLVLNELQPAAPTPTITPTVTPTPVIATEVASNQYYFNNSPKITIAWTPSVTGLDELLCVMVGTNNNDNKSVVQSVTYAGVSFSPQVQQPSLRYSEGIELWTLSLGNYPYGGMTSGNIVITQPSYNSIINDVVTVIEYQGAGQNAALNVSFTASGAEGMQPTTTTCSLTTLLNHSAVLSGYAGIKALFSWPANSSNFQYGHKYGTWGSADGVNTIGAGVVTSSYVSLPPFNPAAGIMSAEIPSYSYFTPTATPSVTPTATPTPSH